MTVAILAKGDTLKLFPGREPYSEVWGLNQICLTHDLDRLFVMDDLKLRMPAWDEHLPVMLKSYPKPIWTSRRYEEWPTSVEFPIREVARHFGNPLGLSFYSTVDYMIALAIYEGHDMELFGVDCISPRREETVRCSIARWIAVAQSKGLKVKTHPGSFFHWFTVTGICYEKGMYGYAGPPRIEELCE